MSEKTDHSYMYGYFIERLDKAFGEVQHVKTLINIKDGEHALEAGRDLYAASRYLLSAMSNIAQEEIDRKKVEELKKSVEELKTEEIEKSV
jgi:hypothetical protein